MKLLILYMVFLSIVSIFMFSLLSKVQKETPTYVDFESKLEAIE